MTADDREKTRQYHHKREADALRANFESAIGGLPFPRAVPAAREILLLQLDLQASSIDRVIATGLHEFIDWFQVRLIDIDEELGDHLLHALPEPAPVIAPGSAAPAASQ